MHQNLAALIGCLAILPVSVCSAAAAESAPKLLPPVVAEAPSGASEDMWDKYPAFFARYKTIWLECPVELPLKDAIEAAEWFNKNTAQYRTYIGTCRKDVAHKPERSWPPTPKAAQMRKERFFSQQCTAGKCEWVQSR